jgi:DHA3 family macrolide efflux protein-like MFS transporter
VAFTPENENGGESLMSNQPKGKTGMTTFTIIWVGQVVSLLGTAMTGFALTLWAYEVTGKATPLALVGFFFITPMVVLGPFVGTLVDRGNRKLMMMLSDLAAAFNTAVIFFLFTTNNLEIWHLYITAGIGGIFNGFQWPAFSAAITMMIPKEQYARANGMLEMAGPASQILAPLLAGALIAPIGIKGILIIDLVSAGAAIGTLLFVRIPQPPKTEEGQVGSGGFFKEAAYGFKYIFARPSLLGIQSVFLVANFFSSITYAVLAPLILARSGNDEIVFGSVQTAGAIGAVAGGVLMSIWGGPKRRIHGVLLGWFWAGFLGIIVLGLGQSVLFWVIGIILRGIPGAVINGSNQAIWQAKVAPDVQGRVFATRRLIAWAVTPISSLLAGPLADNVMEPAMAVNGSLTPIFGGLVGTGPGAGIGLLFVICGFFTGITGLIGYLFLTIRDVENILPDHEAVIVEG